MKTFKESCMDMTRLIESCWDSNNPDDGKTFDERLHEKIKGLEGMDMQVIRKVMVNV